MGHVRVMSGFIFLISDGLTNIKTKYTMRAVVRLVNIIINCLANEWTVKDE